MAALQFRRSDHECVSGRPHPARAHDERLRPRLKGGLRARRKSFTAIFRQGVSRARRTALAAGQHAILVRGEDRHERARVRFRGCGKGRTAGSVRSREARAGADQSRRENQRGYAALECSGMEFGHRTHVSSRRQEMAPGPDLSRVEREQGVEVAQGKIIFGGRGSPSQP